MILNRGSYLNATYFIVIWPLNIIILRLLICWLMVILISIAVSSRMLIASLISLMAIFGSFWVHCEVSIRVLVVIECTPLVMLKLMRLYCKLSVRLGSLIGIMIDNLFLRGMNLCETTSCLTSLIGCLMLISLLTLMRSLPMTEFVSIKR